MNSAMRPTAPVSVITTTWRMIEPVTKGAARGAPAAGVMR